ncbi:hypothetical protein [Aliirhizobium smilacinae]|uniref:Glycosyltransferase RgtA/B/C/D-like domain-containing protein n=1 Tax=Aliirhizobium smilacinae TaxID=1395944 RepID=A0A5C4XJX3_9HYPH|nr:hypothetical protein [Rhizobium smilacinae]TNM63598.1 hypothetical protein FHP24_12410 [Rhizobium smilacinae]
MKTSLLNRDIYACSALLFGYSAVVALMSLDLNPRQWGVLDAELYHLPQINWFMEWGIQLNYPAWSATGPGFHWLMAAFAQLTGAEALDRSSWQCLYGPAFLTATALLFFYAALRSSGASPLRTLAFGFPLISSTYFWTPALYPVTECLSMLGLFAMAYALAASPRQPLTFGIAAAASTIARQSFLSTAGAFALMTVSEQWPRIFTWRVVGPAILTLGPSLVVATALILQWGGLTPPEWKEMHAGFSPGPVLHGLALLGIFGWLFLRREDFADDVSTLARNIAVIVAFSLALWFALPEDGGTRPHSVVWKVAASLPAFYGRPLLTLPLLTMGVIIVFAYWRRGWRDGYRLSPELSLFACYFAAQAAQKFSFQRYAEIPVLLLLCLGMARLKNKHPRHDAFMIMAFAGYFALTIWRMTGSG